MFWLKRGLVYKDDVISLFSIHNFWQYPFPEKDGQFPTLLCFFSIADARDQSRGKSTTCLGLPDGLPLSGKSALTFFRGNDHFVRFISLAIDFLAFSC